ncbi:MAG: hypothetical protein FWF67_07585 [Fibromonadales bacterium]|nr:hypothetical protein [Fibromonadales bacterium]
MSYQDRLKLYKSLEESRQRPLISYVTSIRPNIAAQMASDVITYLIDQINEIPLEKKEIDFLIISNGGDPITALRIITILRERFEKITVLVPYVAFSAATILALGADEIIMHPYSNLGPVDPQLSIIKQNKIGQQSQFTFSSEDIRNYIEFIRSDVGITDQQHLISAFNSLAGEVGSLPIGSSKRSQQLSLSLSAKMLETHMEDKNKAASIAKALNSSYYHHGYAVGRKEAKEIGLNIVYPEVKIEKVLWDIWIDFCNEMKCNQIFDPISEILNNPIAKQNLSNLPTVPIPLNTPPELVQNVMGQFFMQMQAKISQQPPIELDLLSVTIESAKAAYNAYSKHNVAYWRDINMAIAFSVTSYFDGWVKSQGESVC